MKAMMDAIAQDEILEAKEYIEEVFESIDFNRIDMEAVRFVRCRFVACDFSGCALKQMLFDCCDFSNCKWKGSYFRDSFLTECKGDGSDFNNSSFINTRIHGGTYHYGNFSMTLWENSEILNSEWGDSFFSEVKFKKTRFDNVNLIRCDFFKTVLKGMDLSTCFIDGISVSDTFRELKGLKLNGEQAVVIAQLLGVKFV